MSKNIKNVQLTIPQLLAVMAHQLYIYLEWARGSGKSTIIAYYMREMVMTMPRATFVLVGNTYSQILSRTLPSTIEGLELFGLFQDVDYVVGRCGKKHGYAMPFQPPNQWNNVIHFANGACFVLVSLDNPNSGRGLNSYAEVGDEAALMDSEKLFTNVKTTNRAKKEIFSKARLLGAEIYVSSTPITKKGKWFTDMELVAKENPGKYLFLKASAKSNPYLRADWFEKMREQSPSKLLYEAEILNIRPKEIVDGFYANLTPDHYYTDYNNSYLESIGVKAKAEHFNCNQDNDIDPSKPLILSFDFGVFNCCVASQQQDDVYKVLKSFWVKSPKLLDDLLIEQIIPYYSPHREKIAYLYGGHDGNNRLPNSSKTLFEQVQDILSKHGWLVYIMQKKTASTHFDRYLLLNAMFRGESNNLPKIAINEENNRDLIIALERTEAREGLNGAVEKVKKDERNPLFPQQHAPHLTDAFDAPLASMFMDQFKNQQSYYSELRIQTT